MLGLGVRIDYFLFGYRRLSVKNDDLAKASTLLLTANIPVSFDAEGVAVLPKNRVKRVSAILEGKCEYSLSELCGFAGWLYRNRKRYGALGALLFVTLFTVYSSGIVWDIRVEGGEVSEITVIEELDRCGFSVGTSWSKSDLSRIETELISTSEKIAWLNINRRGTVAYIEARARLSYPVGEESSAYANIIATEGGVIEDITVKGGVAAVKAGESVKEGDLLISGAIPDEYGGGFARADGSVRARISERISVSVDRESSVVEHGKAHLCRVRVNIFGFLINIFKTYGNPELECDIIEETENILLFGRYKLPIMVMREYRVERVTQRVVYTDEEMAKIAASRLRAKTLARLSDSDLVSISTGGEFTNTGYVMYSDAVYVKEIGVSVEFKVE